MTPENKFNKNVLYVLNKIKERSLYTKTGALLEYWVLFDFLDGSGETPLPKDEIAILEKLEEWGAIKIKMSAWEYE